MKIVIVGLGRWGTTVHKRYKELEQEIKGLKIGTCDLEKKSDYNTIVEVCEDKKVDGVHICVPNEYHYPLVNVALYQKKNVLVEKPMTTNAVEAYTMIEVANENGCILQVGHILRFMDVVRKAKDLFHTIGSLKYISFRWTHNYIPLNSEHNVIWDLLPHPLDMIHFITGEFPNRWNTYYMEKNALVLLGYNKFIVQGELSWITQMKQRILCMVGTHATMIINTDNSMIVFNKDSQQSKVITVPPKDAIKEEAKNFIDSIKNHTIQYNSGIIGARNTDIVERIIHSSQKYLNKKEEKK